MRPVRGAPEPELVPSFDGTLIAVRSQGRGGRTPLLIVNALGATLAAWRPTLAHLPDKQVVVTWDHRGLHDSGPPSSDRIDPGAHVEDAVAVLDHQDLERVAVVSWSNGARVALELAHTYPERVALLGVVCGGYGHALTDLVRHFQVSALFPTVAGVAKHFAGPVGAALRALTARPELAGLIRQSGMVGATADTAALVDLLKGVAECDPRMLLASYEAVAGDAASEILSAIEAPALLIAGGRDPFAPPRMMREMAGAIPGARLEVYEGATHYLPLEFPARLARDLVSFWDEGS
jgi:3-oxoadipate enol-lactonase